MTFPLFQLFLDGRPDHVQAILIVLAGGIQPGHHFLGQRHQEPFVPEFLASHAPKINRI